MGRITADSSFVAQIPLVASPLEVRDSAGRMLGWFIPTDPRGALYARANALFDDAEIERAAAESGGYSTDEVLQHLASPNSAQP